MRAHRANAPHATEQTMPDEAIMAELSKMTPAELATLRELAQNMQAGRKVWRWIVWLGGVATGLSALGFYLHALWTGRQ